MGCRHCEILCVKIVMGFAWWRIGLRIWNGNGFRQDVCVCVVLFHNHFRSQNRINFGGFPNIIAIARLFAQSIASEIEMHGE
jgi:hypothetical protein